MERVFDTMIDIQEHVRCLVFVVFGLVCVCVCVFSFSTSAEFIFIFIPYGNLVV